MAIQTRRGNEVDFDASKMHPGEWAVSLDTKYVRMCFSPGVVYRMATYESFEEDMIQIQQILATCEDIQTAVEAFEELAEQHAQDAEESAVSSANSATESGNSAKLSKSWAIGGEEIRPGENTNNAKYWCEQASAIANIDIATNTTVGIVKGNADEIDIDSGGQMTINSSFTPQETLVEVTGEEDKKTFFGKVAKVITDFLAHAANLSIHFGLTNNLLATVSGTALDAVQGKALNDKITTLKTYTFTKATTYTYDVSVSVSRKAGVLYLKLAIYIPITASWQNINIGSINNWDNGAINLACVLHSIGGSASSVLAEIDVNGVVHYATQAAIGASDWFYGRSSVPV